MDLQQVVPFSDSLLVLNPIKSEEITMRYVQIRAFHYVALHGGFSRAADALSLTQPAISDQVRKLESENDVRLFDRRSKKVSLTPAGENLLAITHRLFEAEESVIDFLSESRALHSGKIVVMADSVHHITNMLTTFRQTHPEVLINLRAGNTEKILNSLRSYESDIGILGEMPANPEYCAVKLNSTPIVAFAPRASKLIGDRPIALADLSLMPLVLREKGSKTRAKLEEVATAQGIKLNIVLEAEGREAVREIVIAGGGVGVVSEAEFDANIGIKKIPIKGKKMIMDEALVYLRERKDSKLIKAFMSVYTASMS